MPTTHRLLLSALLLVTAQAVGAQSVTLAGVLGSKALLIVDGNPPKAVAVGQRHMGVKLLALKGGQAEVEIGGVQQTLQMGQGPISANAPPPSEVDNQRVVLSVSEHGHFKSMGQINGRAVEFLLDTGASFVSLSVADAERIGLNYKAGRPVPMQTANGPSTGWFLQLDSVRLGDVQVHGIDAVVTPAPMPFVLLGNSFLSRFQMTRTNHQMVLERRF